MRLAVSSLLVAIVFVTTGCTEVKTEFSPTIHEDAVIVSAVHTPARHDVGLGMTAMDTGVGHMDFNGNMGVPIGGGMQISSVETPEKFAVVFRCQHGEFIIQRREIYDRFHNLIGSTADVTYREEYRVTYEKREGVKEVTDRVLVDYDFLNAVLKVEE